MIQGATQVALTCLDVLGYLDEIPVCTGYEIDGQVTDVFPTTPSLLKARPVFTTLPGWKCDIRGCTDYNALPANARAYVDFLEQRIGWSHHHGVQRPGAGGDDLPHPQAVTGTTSHAGRQGARRVCRTGENAPGKECPMKKLFSGLLAAALTLTLAVPSASALELEDAKTLLSQYYYNGVPEEVLELDSLDAILEALDDPYTYYMTPEQYESFNQSVNGREVTGIGATVETAFEGGYLLLSVLPDSPALEAGLQPGDRLVAVDGTELTAQIDPPHPHPGGGGHPGHRHRPAGGERLDFTMTRRTVLIPIVTYELVDGAAYLDCTSFGASTAATFQEAIQALDDDTAVWIVDLRSNPGGDSRSTAATAALFIGGGVMLYFRDGAGNYNYTYTGDAYPD